MVCRLDQSFHLSDIERLLPGTNGTSRILFKPSENFSPGERHQMQVFTNEIGRSGGPTDWDWILEPHQWGFHALPPRGFVSEGEGEMYVTRTKARPTEWKRHLVPVSSFSMSGYSVRRRDELPFFLAGVTKICQLPDGGWAPSTVLLTVPSGPSFSVLSERMPAIIDAVSWKSWLSGSPDEAHALLCPWLGDAFEIIPTKS